MGKGNTAIREARQRLGLSQRELAERAGISRQSVSYAESGQHRPYRTTLVKIAHALGVAVEDIYQPPPDPKERERWIVRGLLDEVNTGTMTVDDALEALQREGIITIGPMRTTRSDEIGQDVQKPA